MESGLWQCFKTKEKGSIVHLVSLMEGISYFEALTLFNRKLLDSPELLFVESKEIRQEHIRRGYRTIIEETKNFKKLSEASRYSDLVSERLAYKFVQYRGLEHQTFYVGTKGKFVNRLIIPFSWNNNMEYFQARLLTDYGMKYLNPSSKEYGIKSSDLLYPFNEHAQRVVVTEGPLDAISLQGAGVNATSTQGSNLSHSQLNQLVRHKIVLAYDNDEPGRHGMVKAAQMMKSKNMPNPFKAQPPKKYKDWGDFYMDTNKKEVKDYILVHTKEMDFYNGISEQLD